MGETIRFICHYCGHDEYISMGVGMHWDIDKLFNGIVDNAKKGQYGYEWKDELKKDPSLVVDVSDEIYICPSCGYFKTDINLSLYKPVEKIKHSIFKPQKRYGTDLTLESNPHYDLFKHYPHLCPKCNGQLTVRSNQNEEIQPACPKCGKKGELCRGTLWD